MTELIIGVLIAFGVCQTMRVWMYQVQYERELKRHCDTMVNKEKTIQNIQQELHKYHMTLVLNGKSAPTLGSDEWPDELI